MWDIFQSIGSIAKVKEKGSFRNYQKKLKGYQENEANVLIDMGVLCFENENFDKSLQYLECPSNIF